MSNTFTVTIADIQSRLQQYDFTGAISSFVTDLIEEYSDMWADRLKREGYDPESVTEPGRLLRRSRRFIINMVAAEVGDSITQQDTPLAKGRRERAKDAAKYLHASPESVDDDWDTNEQRGSFRSNVRMTGIEPGQRLDGGGVVSRARFARRCGRRGWHRFTGF